MRHPLSVSLAILFAAAAAFGQGVTAGPAGRPTPDPAEILRESGAACRLIKTIEYVAEAETKRSSQKGHAHMARATVRQERAAGSDIGYLPGKFSVEGLITHDDGGVPTRFALTYDGKALRTLHPKEKMVKVIHTPSQYVAGQMLGALPQIGIGSYTNSEQFAAFLKKGTPLTYEGTADAHGVECHVVAASVTTSHPAFGENTSVVRLLIGVGDKLPRGIYMSGWRQTVRITRVNGAIPDSAFVLATPQGYGEKLLTGPEPRRQGLLAVGVEAPGWKLSDPQGRMHSLADYRGKLVLLDFWATWCVPCLKTMPVLQQFHEKYKDRGVAVLGVSVGEESGDPAAFMKHYGFTYQLLVKGDPLSELYKTATLPTLYVIGDDGKIIHAEFGLRAGAKEELNEMIDKYLKACGR